MSEFLLNVIADIIGSILFIVVVALTGFYIKSKIPFRSLITLVREFISPGGMFFYSNRKNLRDALGTVDEYISTASQELVYIGFWLDTLLSNAKFGERLIELANKGTKVQIYILTPDTPLLSFYAKRVGKTANDLMQRIIVSRDRLLELKGAVLKSNKAKFSIYFHDRPIGAACFMFDRDNEKKGKILLDHAFINSDDERSSYGFEIRLPSLPMYQYIRDTFKDIEESAVEIENYKPLSER